MVKEVVTNVYDVAISVQHDVAIVPILYLEKEPYHTVRSHRLDKVSPCILQQRDYHLQSGFIETVKRHLLKPSNIHGLGIKSWQLGVVISDK